MAVKKTQKILEELGLLEVSDNTIASIEAEDREKIKAYWANKKIQKQLLKDISQEDYHDGIFCMFNIFYQEDEEAAKGLVNKLSKDFSRPQGLLKELFSTADTTFEDLKSPEISYHTVYFAQHFDLTEEAISQVFEDNKDLLPALTSAANSLGNRFKKFILQSTFIQNIFRFLDISLPPDLAPKEIAAYVNQPELQYSDEGSELARSEKVEPSENAKTSKSVARDGSVDHSSIKAKEPTEDRGLGQDNSNSATGEFGDWNLSSIHPNPVDQFKDAERRDFIASPVKIVPIILGEHDRQEDAEESSEEILSRDTRNSKIVVDVIPFKLPGDDNSAEKSPVSHANPYTTLVSTSLKDFPRMAQGELQNVEPVDLATFYPSPSVDKSTKSDKVEVVKKVQPPALSTSSVIKGLNPEESTTPVDLSKFYKSSSAIPSNNSVALNPIIEMIMSPDRRQSSVLKPVHEEESSSSELEQKPQVTQEKPHVSVEQTTPSKLAALPVDLPQMGSVHALTPVMQKDATPQKLAPQPALVGVAVSGSHSLAPFNLLNSLQAKSSQVGAPSGNDSFARFIEAEGGNAGFYSPVVRGGAEDSWDADLGEGNDTDEVDEADEDLEAEERSYSDSDIPDLMAINPNKSQEIVVAVDEEEEDYLDVPNLKKVNHFRSQELHGSEDEDNDEDSKLKI